jgi:hypothetical protein
LPASCAGQRRVPWSDESGTRSAGRLAWLYSTSIGTDVLLAVHPKRGTNAMNAIGTHALCNAPALRELIYVIGTAAGPVTDYTQQAVTALRRLCRLVADARAADQTID